MEKRYVGTTDEVLLPRAERMLRHCREEKGRLLGQVELVVASPMLRCRQTAEILFPDQPLQVETDFRECDFGAFEYRNYVELQGNPDYQRFIDTCGQSEFPGGEQPGEFRQRCRNAFEGWLPVFSRVQAAALVVHGGTIMSVMECFAVPHRDYYCWQVENGRGYAAELVIGGRVGEMPCRIMEVSEF